MIQRALSLTFCFLLCTSLFSLEASEVGKLAKRLKKNESTIIKNYWKLHKKFSRQLCRPGSEEKFWKLFRGFRGHGHYLPRTVDNKLDIKTLNRFIPELKEKRDWIESQKKKLSEIKNFDDLIKELKELEEDVEKLVNLKELYNESDSDTVKISLKNKSKYLFITFKRKFKDFLKKTPFLTSYRYPVDHFELRENYDEVKNIEDAKARSRANEVYFYRKVVQDGSNNPNGSHSDTFLRAMLDTLTLTMDKNPDFIPEDTRYDLNSAFYGLEKQLKRGPKGQVKRFQEWQDRVERMLDFYESLKKNRVKVGGHYETGEQIIQTQAKARKELKSYVFNKHKDVYEFWASQDEIYQALYVITTILFNEVGGIDGSHALERRDVTQVVLNRVNHPKYNFIPESDFLYDYLKPEGHKGPIKTHPWLNVLFKEGEFSFTYYFIHGAVRVFCPDMTRSGRRLRKKNLSIALERLKDPLGPFKGLRYFSRASMLGRISMDDIWSDYRPISERAGAPIHKGAESILKQIKKGEYKYRYHFNDDSGRRFKVIEVDDDVYALDPKTNQLYTYRNPHYFRYFEALE